MLPNFLVFLPFFLWKQLLLPFILFPVFQCILVPLWAWCVGGLYIHFHCPSS